MMIFFLILISCEEERPVPALPEERTVSTLAGGEEPGLVDGSARAARFSYPGGMVFDPEGNLYVADYGNHAIRKITPAGEVSTYAGTGQPGFANGHRTQATFHSPYGLALDSRGNLYVGDVRNHAIRRIAPDGMVTTLAGGQKGFSDRDGTVARFNHPHGIAVDFMDNIYVADAYNNRVRKITPRGDVSTLAGNGNDGFLDGTGAEAELYVPVGIVVGPRGNIYVADEGNSSIRKITPEGIVSTLAGNGRFAFCDGVGKKAEFNAPGGLAVDAEGNLYIADYFNNCIRRVTPAGAVHKIAGNLEKGFADGPSSEAEFHYPFGIAVAPDGVIYVGDHFNHRIRKIN